MPLRRLRLTLGRKLCYDVLSVGVFATEHPMSVHDDMIEEYEKQKATLQRQIIALEFGHIEVGDYLAGARVTCAIETARREISAIDTAVAGCRREKARHLK